MFWQFKEKLNCHNILSWLLYQNFLNDVTGWLFSFFQLFFFFISLQNHYSSSYISCFCLLFGWNFLQMNGYTFKKSNSTIFRLSFLLSGGTFLKERISLPRRKFFSWIEILFLKGFETQGCKQEDSKVVSDHKNGGKIWLCSHIS